MATNIKRKNREMEKIKRKEERTKERKARQSLIVAKKDFKSMTEKEMQIIKNTDFNPDGTSPL